LVNFGPKINPIFLFTHYKQHRPLFNPIKPIKNKVEIKFSKPKMEVEQALAHFGVDDANDAGSLAFDYFYENAIN
jgi:hypothetical protein